MTSATSLVCTLWLNRAAKSFRQEPSGAQHFQQLLGIEAESATSCLAANSHIFPVVSGQEAVEAVLLRPAVGRLKKERERTHGDVVLGRGEL